MTASTSESTAELVNLLRDVAPFSCLPPAVWPALALQLERRWYGLGQTVLRDDVVPDGVVLVLQGKLRSLAPEATQAGLCTIDLHGPGELVGWAGLLRAEACEHLRASSELEVLWLEGGAFLNLLEQHPELQQWCDSRVTAEELYRLLLKLVMQDHRWSGLLEHWPAALTQVKLRSLPLQEAIDRPPALAGSCVWFASHGPLNGQPWPSGQEAEALQALAEVPAGARLRLIGLPPLVVPASSPVDGSGPPEGEAVDDPGARPYSHSPEPPPQQQEGRGSGLRLRRASGPRNGPLAICEAVARYFGVPFDRDGLSDQVDGVLQRQSQLNLVNMGQLISSMGLRVVLAQIPADRLARVPTPAVLAQGHHLAVLSGVEADGRVGLLEPELGPIRLPLAELLSPGADTLELLLIERSPQSKEDRFSWAWFGPFLKPFRRELVEVLAASFLVNLLMLATPLGTQVLVDMAARSSQNLNALISISALLLLAGVVLAVVRTLRSFIFTEVANRVDQATKATILDQLVRLPQGFFDSRPVGQITFYFTQLDRLREFLIGESLTTVVDFLFSFLYIFVLLAINPLMTLVTVSTLPLILLLALLSNPIVENLLERSIGHAVRTYSYLTEAITGIQTIKSQNAELKTRWEFQDRYSRFIGEDYKLRITNETVNNLAGFINELNGLLVIGFGIWLVMQGQLTLGGLFAFRIISGYITRPMVQMVQTWQKFKQCSLQLKMVGDVVNRPTEQSDAEATNIPMPPLRGQVAFRDVTFRFGETAPLVLHGITLEIPVGAFVGMVGGSGSGKSTLLKLLPRFYRAETGRVLIDGYDINKVELYSLRRQIGVVPQDSLLFDGTIKENLQLVKPDATVDEMIRAARIACAHDFIMEMAQGYNSSVGERGAGLSGGQRQRLALARAVLQNPRMLILDEATSALDARTERQVCLNLFEAFRGRTVFFITHRLSTVRPADMIVVMDQGAVMEVGSHNTLMEFQGWYYALFQSQNQEGLS